MAETREQMLARMEKVRAARGKRQPAPGSLDPVEAPFFQSPSESSELHELVAPPQSIFSQQTMGQLADALIGNAAFDEAYRRAISECAKAWENTKADEQMLREHYWHMVAAMRALRREIETIGRRADMREKQEQRLRVHSR